MTVLSDVFGSDGAAYIPTAMTSTNNNFLIVGDQGGSATLFNGTSSGTPSTFTTVLTFTGKGQLQALLYHNTAGTGGVKTIKVTLDGVSHSIVAGSLTTQTIVGVWDRVDSSDNTPQLLSIESIPFKTSLLIEFSHNGTSVAFNMAFKYVETA